MRLEVAEEKAAWNKWRRYVARQKFPFNGDAKSARLAHEWRLARIKMEESVTPRRSFLFPARAPSS
jgi:hypothetical protein